MIGDDVVRADLGLQTAELDLFSSEPAHVAAVVNVLHELVKQRHRDKAKQQENHEKLQKLRSDLRVGYTAPSHSPRHSLCAQAPLTVLARSTRSHYEGC